MLDPNWFYSTLAQSTAALVGLAGGFLAQRVLAQRGDLSGERQDLITDVDFLYSTLRETRLAARHVVESMDNHLPVVEQAKENGQNEVVLQRGLLTTFSHGRGYASDGTDTWPTETAETYLRDTRDAAAALLKALPSERDELITRVQNHGSLDQGEDRWLRDAPGDFPIDEISPENVWRWMPFQRAQAQDRFRTHDRSVEKLSGRVQRLRAKLLPQSLYVLLGILVLLLIAGVIAPMFFLSAKSGASQPVLIVAFILLSVGFLLYLGYELRRLRQAGDLTNDF